MKILKTPSLALACFFVMLFACSLHAQSNSDPSSSPVVTPEELKLVIGEWTGTLTYINYSNGKPFTMPADLIAKPGSNPRQLNMSNIYPNEPKANGSYKMRLSKDGRKLNKQWIVEKEKTENGGLIVTTEYAGKDDNKKATIRIVYTIDENQFITRKNVRFSDSKEWINRNEFSYSRKN